MNHMEDISKLLNITLYTKFKCNDGFEFTYELTDHGLLCNGAPAPDCLTMLLDGTMVIKEIIGVGTPNT